MTPRDDERLDGYQLTIHVAHRESGQEWFVRATLEEALVRDAPVGAIVQRAMAPMLSALLARLVETGHRRPASVVPQAVSTQGDDEDDLDDEDGD